MRVAASRGPPRLLRPLPDAHVRAGLHTVTKDDERVRVLSDDWRTAELDDRLSAMLAFAEKPTLTRRQISRADHEPLRAAGLDDRGILEVVEETAYFNFVNRLADGLGVSLEPDRS